MIGVIMANDIDQRKAQILLRLYKIKEQEARSAKLKENVDTLLNKPKPNQWAVGSYVGRKNSEGRASFKRAIVDEVSAESSLYQSTAEIEKSKHYLERVPTRLRQQDETEDNGHRQQTAQYENTIAVYTNATDNGLTRENEELRQKGQLAIAQKKKEDMLEYKKKKLEMVLQQEEKDKDSKRKVDEDYQIRINQLKAVLALKTFPYMKLAEIRKYIRDLLLEHETVFADKLFPQVAKTEYLVLLNQTIEIFKGSYERGLRLLQTVDGGEELGRIDGYAELGSGVSDIVEALDDEI